MAIEKQPGDSCLRTIHGNSHTCYLGKGTSVTKGYYFDRGDSDEYALVCLSRLSHGVYQQKWDASKSDPFSVAP